MFQFKSNNTQQRKKWRFKMNFADRFLNWYQKYFTEITWFLIGDLTVQVANALTKHDYVEVVWCSLFIVLNYIIWKRQR